MGWGGGAGAAGVACLRTYCSTYQAHLLCSPYPLPTQYIIHLLASHDQLPRTTHHAPTTQLPRTYHSTYQARVLASASEMLDGDLYEVVALHRRHKTRGQLHRSAPPPRRAATGADSAGSDATGDASASASANASSATPADEYARRAAHVQKALCQQLHGTKPGGRRPTPPKRRRAQSVRAQAVGARLPGADAPEIRVELNLSALFL